MKFDLNKFLVQPNNKCKLKDFPTRVEDAPGKKELKKKYIKPNMKEMKDLQAKLYAENTQALLLCLQAMDTAGKDSAIKHVMSGVNPQGCKVVSFKQPSAIELDHDYLWRIHKNVPPRGEIGIFNRSHYEEVLVTRVHNLVEKQQIPESLIDGNIWDRRFNQINNFETYLYENGYKVVKIYLHLSKEEQTNRLVRRIDRPDKNWKFSVSDIEERQYWDKYMMVYEDLLQHTSTEESPWYIVPADDKWFARFVISEIVLKHLKEMDPHFPTLDKDIEKRLGELREKLVNGEV